MALLATLQSVLPEVPILGCLLLPTFAHPAHDLFTFVAVLKFQSDYVVFPYIFFSFFCETVFPFVSNGFTLVCRDIFVRLL